MTKYIEVVEAVAARVVTHHQPGPGTVDLSKIGEAVRAAEEAHRHQHQAPDDVDSLRESVNLLAGAVRTLAGELYQVARAAQHGQIAVTGTLEP